MSRQRIDTQDPVGLSRPERHVYNSQKRGIVDMVKAAGGCWFCLRRDEASEAFGRALCGKVQPARFLRYGCEFDPDQTRIHSTGDKS